MDDRGELGAQLIQGAQKAAAAAIKAAGQAAVAMAYGLVALAAGAAAAMMAAVAMFGKVAGEALALLAVLIREAIENVVRMVPQILSATIGVLALASIWMAWQWAWIGFAQDMPSGVAAVAALLVAAPVVYGFVTRLWPITLAGAMVTLGAGWLVMNTNTLVRIMLVVGILGAIVWKDIMVPLKGRNDA